MTDTLDTEVQPWTFTFPAENLEEFHHLIGKANRRLARAGAADARFTPAITVNTVTEVTVDGIEVSTEMATATMDSLRLSLGRYTFVARLVPESAGMTVHTAPGESLAGWERPAADDMHCDHCGTDRYRVNLFVVRDEDTGQFIQLGQQCIQLYTGMKPKGLWALTFDADIDAWATGQGGEGGGSRTRAWSINQVLGLALALTGMGKGYISRARAEERGLNATGGDIHRCLNRWLPTDADCRRSDRLRAERDRLLAAISDGLGYAADEDLMAEVKAAADTLNSDSDYAWNLAVILAADSGTVSSKNVNTLGSLVLVFHRLREDVARKAAAPKVAGFIGKVGDRLRDFDVNVTAVRSLEGDYGTTTLMVGTTDDGHTVKWFASGDRDWQAGDRLHFGAATVKAHETYQGTDQTALTRGHKVEVIDQG